MKQTDAMKRMFSATGRWLHNAAIVLLFTAALSGLPACTRHEGSEPGGGQPYTRTYSAPPLQVALHLDRTEITTAERLALQLTATLPEGYRAEFPSITEQLGDFTVIDQHRSQPRLATNNLVELQVNVLLEPFLAGSYTIPPLSIRALREEASDTTIPEVQTEAIQITVQSLLPPGEDAAAQIKDIRPPLPLERRLLDMAWLVLITAVLITGVAALFWWRHRRQSVSDGDRLPPDPAVTARLALEQLLAADLVRRGEIKLFHVRVSDILRHYIEERFGLRAPGRTTEEFLGELGSARGNGVDSNTICLPAEHKSTLKDFLSQCDLVKFARYQPTEEASMKTIDICRRFVDETTSVVHPPSDNDSEIKRQGPAT